MGLRRGYLILRCSTGAPTDVETLARLRGAETIGRPLGTRKFLDMLERKTKRVLKPAKRGPKPRIQES
jgi:putative transposase